MLERIGQKLNSEQAQVEEVKARLAEKEAQAAAIAHQFNSLVGEVHRETEHFNRALVNAQITRNALGDKEISTTSNSRAFFNFFDYDAPAIIGNLQPQDLSWNPPAMASAAF